MYPSCLFALLTLTPDRADLATTRSARSTDLLEPLPRASTISRVSLIHNSLPSGTNLPGGAVLPMAAVADFPMVLPKGTKLPGGVMVPVRCPLLVYFDPSNCISDLKARPDGAAVSGQSWAELTS